jgi:uncharacterized Ntn-hydrolase superfamily protein
MTFSIVAVDHKNGEAGFAISSCSWDSGVVGLTKGGIGAIVSQAKGNMVFRELFFQKMREGLKNEEILAHFKELDPHIETRQVGMITYGGPLSFTGEKCTPYAGHRLGEYYAVQGNILVSSKVVDSMAEAYESIDASLAEKLFAALQAGDDAGGDARGKQSARICVTKKDAPCSDGDVLLDIRVEDHEEPVREVGRILKKGLILRDIFQLTTALSNAIGEEKIELLDKLEDILQGREDRAYIDFWSTLGNIQLELGFKEKAIRTFRKYLQTSPNMRPIFEAYVEKGDYPEEILQ